MKTRPGRVRWLRGWCPKKVRASQEPTLWQPKTHGLLLASVLLLALVVWSLLFSSAFSMIFQTGSSGTQSLVSSAAGEHSLVVQVVNERGEGVQGAEVSVSCGWEKTASEFTGRRGYAVFENLLAETYIILVSLQGYKSQSSEVTFTSANQVEVVALQPIYVPDTLETPIRMTYAAIMLIVEILIVAWCLVLPAFRI